MVSPGIPSRARGKGKYTRGDPCAQKAQVVAMECARKKRGKCRHHFVQKSQGDRGGILNWRENAVLSAVIITVFKLVGGNIVKLKIMQMLTFHFTGELA